MMTRPQFLRLAAAAALAATVGSALAQSGKPIEWVVGYAAGGGSDVVARTVAEQMQKSLGQTPSSSSDRAKSWSSTQSAI